MKYQILRNNSTTKGVPMAFRNHYFKTYEEARSAIRKWIRKNRNMDERLTIGNFSKGELFHYNPSISDFHFSIKGV